MDGIYGVPYIHTFDMSLQPLNIPCDNISCLYYSMLHDSLLKLLHCRTENLTISSESLWNIPAL